MKKGSNPSAPDIKYKPKPPPAPPAPWPSLCIMLREDGGSGTCPKCDSTIIRTIWLDLKCIHPDCDYYKVGFLKRWIKFWHYLWHRNIDCPRDIHYHVTYLTGSPLWDWSCDICGRYHKLKISKMPKCKPPLKTKEGR